MWGRYFENPLLSRFLTRVSRYDNEAVEEYPLLKEIVKYRNEKKYPLSINGISSLEYLAGIKEENYSSRNKIVLKPTVSPVKKLLRLVNMKVGRT